MGNIVKKAISFDLKKETKRDEGIFSTRSRRYMQYLQNFGRATKTEKIRNYDALNQAKNELKGTLAVLE